MSDSEIFSPKLTSDGSFTFFSQEFNELFHSHFGARQESFQKFAYPTQLQIQAQKPILRLLDICYGLGYNTAAALQTIWEINPHCQVEIIALEQNSSVPQAAVNHHLFQEWDCKYTDILTQLAYQHQIQNQSLTAKLLIGDARQTISQVITSGFQADAIFLDPFSPPQCPQLWTIEFIDLVAKCLHIEGRLATYSCAASVRVALLAAGLAIGSTPPVGRKSPGTVAMALAAETSEQEFDTSKNIPIISSFPLSPAEIEHLQTRAAVPYRDPQLQDCTSIIRQRRQQEQQDSTLEGTSQWRKRWFL
jgi:tRNA U34 5-methylaminomethyl-2-thiouridine-forming methyltransferase MnmC